MKHIILNIFLAISLLGFSQEDEKMQIDKVLTDWHKAASNADFENYFGLMTKDGVFLGTDATENWQNKEFRAFSKPYFDKGKAWSFTAVERNIYVNVEAGFAWFDELLDTQMELCRGSGVLKKENEEWKIAHYVLSIAIPNENVKDIVIAKKKNDSILKSRLKNKKM
ncbi:nuclear transport factor 2 family protein [Spongiivirga citrea]|uniref:SnoaL-like domain-containing protein n=1 Tax=Spongiivirga citrea TaxID=1481457 RepID=A0A6M0CQ13_9FLAO|nr:nuclear transport factor 2 family protein [Spongiivirga citrea]NER17959.1 hypothetical protein [Spongiivirga citrea]